MSTSPTRPEPTPSAEVTGNIQWNAAFWHPATPNIASVSPELTITAQKTLPSSGPGVLATNVVVATGFLTSVTVKKTLFGRLGVGGFKLTTITARYKINIKSFVPEDVFVAVDIGPAFTSAVGTLAAVPLDPNEFSFAATLTSVPTFESDWTIQIVP